MATTTRNAHGFCGDLAHALNGMDPGKVGNLGVSAGIDHRCRQLLPGGGEGEAGLAHGKNWRLAHTVRVEACYLQT